METVNFQCGHCSKLMAVTRQLLGRQVRCPHCQQVVVAPNPSTQPGPAPTPPPVPPVPDTLFEPPVLSDQDSIFTPAEEMDEDLFGASPRPQPEMPPEPYWDQPPPEPAPVNLELTAPPPSPEPTVAYTPSPEDFSSPPPPTPTEPLNPWSTLPETQAEPSGVLDSALPPSHGPVSATGLGRRKGPPSWLLPILIIPLITYSIVVTALLAYCYMQLEFERSNDPLKRLLDGEGYNPPATKASKTGLRGPINWKETPLRPLPADLKTTLKQPLRIGDLEVTPRAVEMRTVLIKRRGYDTLDPGVGPSVVLYLELKNVSQDVEFHPLDPWFDRHYKENAQRANIPFTYLEMGSKRIYGAAINDGETRESLLIDGLDADLKPTKDQKLRQNADLLLRPGESMVSFVCTDPEQRVGAAMKSHSGKLLYRVRLRNGISTVFGREVPTTAVMGVEFNKEDVKEVASPG